MEEEKGLEGSFHWAFPESKPPYVRLSLYRKREHMLYIMTRISLENDHTCHHIPVNAANVGQSAVLMFHKSTLN